MLFGGIFSTISAIAEAYFAEGEMNVFYFSGIFSAFNFCLGEGNIRNENDNSNVVGNVRYSALWRSIKSLVNFMRHLTSIKVECFAKIKPEHCSEQYIVRRRGQGLFYNLNCIL
jgi:hypothetical protein